MNKIFKAILIVTVFAGLAGTFSCKRICKAGYESKNCRTEIRSKFIGTYKLGGQITFGGYNTPFADEILTVSPSSSDISTVLLYHPTLGTITATSSGTSLSAPSQVVNISNNYYTYWGNASLNNNILTLTGTQINGGDTSTIQATGIKQ